MRNLSMIPRKNALKNFWKKIDKTFVSIYNIAINFNKERLMKRKIFAVFTSLTLVVVLLMALCACGSTWGTVKSAFEKYEYEEIEPSDEAKALYENNEDFKAAVDTATIHVMKKGTLTFAVILEFKSNADMEEALKKHVTKEDAQNIYEELQKLDQVNGNCFLLAYTPLTDAGNIFKSTK